MTDHWRDTTLVIDQFLSAFGPIDTPDVPQDPPPLWEDAQVAGYRDIMTAFAGATCQNGLYRLHTAASAAEAERVVTEAFPRYRDRLLCVGVDWLGRQYALNRRRPHPADPSEPLLLSFDPEADGADPEPSTFAGFHAGEGIDSCSRERWREWSAANLNDYPLAHADCVGLRIPLFLGGADIPANMAVVNTAAYWRAIVSQLRYLAEMAPLV